LVSELLSWHDAQVRFWALEAAERVFSSADYIKAMKSAVKDSDEAVRDDAIGRLADVAPDQLRPVARSLAARLNAGVPPGEDVFVLWTLAKTRSVELVPKIEAFRMPLLDWWKVARVADVVLLYLREGAGVALRMIENHSDHKRMEELCTLAWHVLGTPDARNALEAGFANAPDEACREACKFGLNKFAG
jgi:hypothetical protein